MTIQELLIKLSPLVGKAHHSPLTINKGSTGLLLETITGIPHTSNCLDCTDGELKTFPVKKLKNNTFVPKETVAVTMVSIDELKSCEFNSSRCAKKMNKVLFVPYYREGETITYLSPTLLSKDTHPAIYTVFEDDYSLIKKEYETNGVLQSSLGNYLQTRTKGAGHGTTSRAFYLRTTFLKEYIPIRFE